jgi:hypothetical protein
VTSAPATPPSPRPRSRGGHDGDGFDPSADAPARDADGPGTDAGQSPPDGDGDRPAAPTGEDAAGTGSPATQPVSVGTLFADRYRIRGLIGSGGMGRVWVARDEMLARDVAIKEVILPDWTPPDERAELYGRALVEARAVAQLNSPYVVQIFDVVYRSGRPWIVMEYVPARSLYQVIRSDGRLTPREAARVGLAVLSALDAAHEAGVLHRDVKPGNVLVGDDGRVVLTDFGLATFQAGGARMTMPGVVLGSPQYTAPERARDGVSTPEADLWSLGATLYAAVEGRAPFARSTPLATLTALAEEPPDPAPHAGALGPVLDGLLTKDPAGRMDREQTRRMLAPLAAGEPAAQARPTPAAGRRAAAPPVSGPPGRRTTAAAGTGAAAGPDADPAGQPRRTWVGRLVVATVVTAFVAIGGATAGLRERGAGAPAAPTPPATLPASPGRPAQTAGGASGPPPVPVAALTEVSPCAAPAPPHAARPAEADPPWREAFVLPQSWRWYHDASGFRVATHADWPATVQAGAVCFHDPSGVRTLGISALRGGVDPVAHIREDESALRSRHASAAYRPVRIVRSPGPRAADWEYRCVGPDGRTPLHAQRRTIQMPDGREYDIFWQTAEADWRDEQDYLALVLVSFRG